MSVWFVLCVIACRLL